VYRLNDTLYLKNIINLLKKKIWLIFLLAFIGFLISFGITKLFIKPKYTSTVSFYVSNTEHLQNKIDYNDINAAQKLANTYSVIMKSDNLLSEAISISNLYQLSSDQIRKMMKVTAVSNTEVIELHVTSENPQLSADIANAIAQVAPMKIKDITKTGDIAVIDEAVPNTVPSSPNVRINCMLGILAGTALAFIYIILKDIMDTTIKGEEDIKNYYDVPILGSIPVLDSPSKGGYGKYGY